MQLVTESTKEGLVKGYCVKPLGLVKTEENNTYIYISLCAVISWQKVEDVGISQFCDLNVVRMGSQRREKPIAWGMLEVRKSFL